MSNPVFIACPADQWTKIATGVTAGMIHKINVEPHMLQTYRDTGDAAPTIRSDGVPVFTKEYHEEIKSGQAIDVYLWSDGLAGNVRVDL